MNANDTWPYYEGPAIVVLDDGSEIQVNAVVYDVELPGLLRMWGAGLDQMAGGPALEPVKLAGEGALSVHGVHGRFHVHTFDHATGRLTVTGVGEPPDWPRPRDLPQ
ncbi:hypothetical protein [Kitasatospora camelliae]|uniref:Uncharacterized protein n=1 Tax=Kitasatospora camelliae TaxID=3156397 RepID=A0AAU8K4G7_9ACTN